MLPLVDVNMHPFIERLQNAVEWNERNESGNINETFININMFSFINNTK